MLFLLIPGLIVIIHFKVITSVKAIIKAKMKVVYR